jgi:hypothetical protein
MKNVILNSFQDLINSTNYETPKLIRGDKKTIMTQSLWGEELFFGSIGVIVYKRHGLVEGF